MQRSDVEQSLMRLLLGQVGVTGSATLELGKNYGDEMGQGDPDGVSTTLRQRLVDAVQMPRPALGDVGAQVGRKASPCDGGTVAP